MLPYCDNQETLVIMGTIYKQGKVWYSDVNGF